MHARPLAGAGTPAHPPPAGPDSTRHPWTLEFRDLPDVAGKRGGATARLMSSTAIAAGDPVAFMAALGYGPAGGYVLDGDQLVHGNVAVQVFRLRPMPAGGFGRADVGRAEVAGWEMLDASGAWVVQASVRVGDGARVEWMVRGAEELAALRAALRGVVELEAADRLALDTRVR
jgi:mediator of RNA polymerase II transcription subunit 18